MVLVCLQEVKNEGLRGEIAGTVVGNTCLELLKVSVSGASFTYQLR